jgi:hypothetical protein
MAIAEIPTKNGLAAPSVRRDSSSLVGSVAIEPRAPAPPALLDAPHPRYFLFRAYVTSITGQGPAPQASVAERVACSRVRCTATHPTLVGWRQDYPHPILQSWCAFEYNVTRTVVRKGGGKPADRRLTVPVCRPAYAADLRAIGRLVMGARSEG